MVIRSCRAPGGMVEEHASPVSEAPPHPHYPPHPSPAHYPCG
jgi:hypothetical protein